MQTQTRKWLTRREAAREAGVSVRTIARWLADGTLTRHGIRKGKGVRIDASELARITEPDAEEPTGTGG